jgi:sigma-B regulation protein RsbU (phosphoserine phosphatase)
MRGIDSVMRQMLGQEQYLTACYARLNRRTRRLCVVSAGHPPLIHADSRGSAQIVELDGDPLGMFNSVILQHKEFSVADGDRFYLYSDGLIESIPGGERRTGIEQLVQACIEFRESELEEAPSKIAARVRPPASSLTDDLLLLAVEVRL